MAGSFVHFSALPVELRLNIWRLARQPRVVEVWYDTEAECCRTTSHPPPILHVNRESRAEALHKGWYRQAFRTRAHADRYIYFSSNLDVLYLPRHGLMGYDDTARDFTVHVRDTADHVRALAVDHVHSDTIRPWEPYNKLMLLLSFPNVRETMLVVGSTAAGTPFLHTSKSSHDRRPVRQRSRDSVEDVPPSPIEKDFEVELVDPQGDSSEIMDVINNVILSFSHEIQAVEAVAERDSDPSNAVNNPFSPFSAKVEACGNGRVLPHLPYLIPKAIEYHRQRQRHRHSMAIRA
ncbi:hypothetical protein F503_01693 [Ophiostoma piceae UAMH 11346]|uniref:2EXR domain-containing protein n=1 Tax=Ophiostoma piceae (strain UAMH 11346) TaxID=1262450 RepID=S3CNW4_OPHP1|nr:hypothetical protein F503_01693 [Ophiostoma piceae UAMH 11346]